MVKYHITGVKVATAEVVYEKGTSSHTGMKRCVEWAFRKGANTVLIVKLDGE